MVSPWQSGHPSVRASSLGWFQRFRPINFSTGFLSLSPWLRFSTHQISWLSIVHWSTSLTIIVWHQDTQQQRLEMWLHLLFKICFHFLQLARASQNQSDVPPNLLEARKCVLWKLNSPHLSFFVPSFKLVTTSWQWYCWYSDWSLSNLQNSMQVIQDGPDDDDTNTDNDESTGIIGCNLWWQPSAESNKLVSAVSSKPSDDCNDGVDRDIQTYQQFENLLLFLSSTEV